MVEVKADESTKAKLNITEASLDQLAAEQVVEKANALGTMQATLKDNILDINQLLID